MFFKTPILAVIEDLMQKENLEECVKLVDSWGWGREDGVLFYVFGVGGCYDLFGFLYQY